MKHRFFTAVIAVFLLLPIMGGAALAGGLDDITETVIPEATPEPTPVPTPTPTPEPTPEPKEEKEPNPFTPNGTGTVVDKATDGDGKEFYTIVTADENVFFLVIDNERNSENVYFLNAVTEADLMSLAVPSEDESAIPDDTGAGVGVVVPADPTPDPELEPDPEQEPEPEKGGSGTLVLAVVMVLVAGGAGYYLKIYRPKQLDIESEEYEMSGEDEAEPEDDLQEWEDSEDEGGLPWDDDYDLPWDDSGPDEDEHSGGETEGVE